MNEQKFKIEDFASYSFDMFNKFFSNDFLFLLLIHLLHISLNISHTLLNEVKPDQCFIFMQLKIHFTIYLEQYYKMSCLIV